MAQRYKIVNVRSGGQYSLMACDLAIGYTNEQGDFVGEFQINGLFLKQKKDGSGFYYDAPFKFREKNGERVKDEKGYDKKDYHFDLFLEKGVGPTKGAHEARKSLIEEMVAAHKAWSGENGGRGAPTPARPARSAPAKAASKPAPAAASTAVEGEGRGTPPGLSDNDDFDLF